MTFFFKNSWFYQICSQSNHLYLNYAINTGIPSLITSVNVYMPSRNALNNELQFFKIRQRLLFNNKRGGNQHLKNVYKFKRRSKIRRFFRISPKLNNKNNNLNKFNKKKKNKNSKPKRLEPKE